MKKNNKVIRKDYKKLDNSLAAYRFEFYGVFKKDGRIKIDPKRFDKTIGLPDSKILQRTTVYYTPTKKNYLEYNCNKFRNLLNGYHRLWNSEYKDFINSIKTPKQAEESSRLANIADGILDIDEVNEKAMIARVKRSINYKMIRKMFYAQFFHQLMSSIDAQCLRLLVSCGYQEEDYTKKQFDIFIQGLQGKSAIAFKDYQNYKIFDKAFTVWNFLKHNSLRSYRILKKHYPEMVWDPKEEYQNGYSALTVLKLDEKYILSVIDNMHLFFDELCARAFNENAEDAQWDYDDYFKEVVQDQIDIIINPLDL